MKTYRVRFSIFGLTKMANVTANSIVEAEKILRDSVARNVVFHDVEPEDEANFNLIMKLIKEVFGKK